MCFDKIIWFLVREKNQPISKNNEVVTTRVKRRKYILFIFVDCLIMAFLTGNYRYLGKYSKLV